MSDEQFALSTSPAPSAPPPTEADYDAIFAAVMETVRGRWFLSEFGRRNRQADTKLVLAAIERLESTMRGDRESQSLERIRNDIREMAKAITLAKREIAAITPDQDHSGRIGLATEELDSIVQTTQQATSDILAAAEQIQETAWTLREQGVDRAACDQIDHRSTDIYLSCSFQDLTGQRTRKVIQVLRYLEGRINSMVETLGVDTSDAPRDETSTDGHATHFATNLDQAEIDEVIPTTHAARMDDVEEHGESHASHLIIDHAPDEVHAADAGPTAEMQAAGSEPPIVMTEPMSVPVVATAETSFEPIGDVAAIAGYETAIAVETPATQAAPLSGEAAPAPDLTYAEAPEAAAAEQTFAGFGEIAALPVEEAASTRQPPDAPEPFGIEPSTDLLAAPAATTAAGPDPAVAPTPWLAEVAVSALADADATPATGEPMSRSDADAESRQADAGIGAIGVAEPSGIEPSFDVVATPAATTAAEPDPAVAPTPWLAEVAVSALADDAAAPAATSEAARLEDEPVGRLDIAPATDESMPRSDADAEPRQADASIGPIGAAEPSGIELSSDVFATPAATMAAEPDPLAAPTPWLAEMAFSDLADDDAAPTATADSEAARLEGEPVGRFDIAPATDESMPRPDADAEFPQAAASIGPSGAVEPSGIELSTADFAAPAATMAPESDPVAAPAPWLAEMAVSDLADDDAASAATADSDASHQDEPVGRLDIAPATDWTPGSDADTASAPAGRPAAGAGTRELPAIDGTDEPVAAATMQAAVPTSLSFDTGGRSAPEHDAPGLQAEPEAEPLAAAAWHPPAETMPVIVATEPPESDAALPHRSDEQAEDETWQPAIERAAASVRPVTPDTELLLANLLSIIRPIAATDDTAEATPSEIVPDQAAAYDEPGPGQDPAEDFALGYATLPIEAAILAPTEFAAALPPMDAEPAPPADAFAAMASARDAEAGDPTEGVAAATIAQPIEHQVEITPIPGVPAAATEQSPFEHPHIVEPGILSSDFVIVLADEPMIEAALVEPVADAPPAVINHSEFAPMPADALPSLDAAADIPHGGGTVDGIPQPEAAAAESPAVPPPAAVPEMDVIAIDAGNGIVLPGNEPAVSDVPLAAAAVEDRAHIEPISFASAPDAAPRQPGPPDMVSPAAEVEPAAIAFAHQPEQDAGFAGAADGDRSTPPAAIAVGPVPTTAETPPVTATAMASEPGSAAGGQTARAGAPLLANDPLAPISWLSVEEKIALFS